MHYLVKPKAKNDAAFSLLELLVVCALVVLLATAILPPASGVLNSMNLSGAGQRLMDELTLARQSALTRNRTVELRVYENSKGELRNSAVVIPAVGTNPHEWLTTGRELPTGVVIDQKRTSFWSYSTETENSSAPTTIQGLKYRRLVFLPDGRVLTPELDAPSAHLLTLRNQRGPLDTHGEPVNFVACVVDPLTGRTRVFQP